MTALAEAGLTSGTLLGAAASMTFSRKNSHALAVARVEVGLDQQLLGGLAARQVELDQPLQQRVLGPSDIGEPAVAATRRHGRGAGQDAAGLGAQLAQPPRGDVRLAREGDRPLRRGHVGDEAAYRAERGVDQKDVEGLALSASVVVAVVIEGTPRGHQWRRLQVVAPALAAGQLKDTSKVTISSV